MTEAPKQARRRRLIVGGMALVVLGFAGVRTLQKAQLSGAGDLTFEPLKDPAGYRVLRGGAVSLGGGVPLFGLDSGEKPAGLLAAQRANADNLCAALFGQPRVPGKVPVAYFFDYQCPICRRLTPRLRERSDISINWHDLAGLGAASETAARAAIASRKQGAYDAFHDRLMRARFQATDGYVRALADSIGIDPDQLVADIANPDVDARMWQSRALANRFAMLGTPGLVIGRTVVIGDISNGDLGRIIRDETANPGPC